MENIIEQVKQSTQSAINKVARSIKQSQPDPELVTAFSKLLNSFTSLVEKTTTEPKEEGWYEKMKRKALEQVEEKQKIRLKNKN